MGVYFRFQRGAYGDAAYQLLLNEREDIDRELGTDVRWWGSEGKPGLGTFITYDKLDDAATLARISEFFSDRLNKFVNALRPRLDRIAREIQGE